MQALSYQVNPLGWLTCKWMRYSWPGCLVSGMNGLSFGQVPAPGLPGDDWVRVRTLMAGICGSDTAVIDQKQPPNSILPAFSSMPCILGHENVAVVEEVGPAVDKQWLGKRVCVEPTLCCRVRGIDPPCERCAEGRYGLCQNFGADGLGKTKLPPGTSIGYNRRIGGSFAELFVAHQSQLVSVPDELSDEQAVLTDPIACALHAALRADQLPAAKRVLIYGAGVLGLSLISALRAIGYSGKIDAIARRRSLSGLADKLGADNLVCLPSKKRDRFKKIASLTGATVQRAMFDSYMLSGGYDVVFDCLTSRRSIDESLKWTRAGGQMVFVGTGHGPGVDLTPIWFRELNVVGAYGRQIEDYDGRRIGTYQLVHEMMAAGKIQVQEILTHKFRLDQYRRAFTATLNKAKYNAIKVVFDFRKVTEGKND